MKATGSHSVKKTINDINIFNCKSFENVLFMLILQLTLCPSLVQAVHEEIPELYFTRGITIKEQLWDLKESGAFRSRFIFSYSNPIGSNFAIETEVPFGLEVPAEGGGVAGLGDISILFQGVKSIGYWRQVAGLKSFLPTGTKEPLGGITTLLNPKYKIDYTGFKYFVPTFATDYYHSILRQDDASDIRILALEPLISFTSIGPSNLGLSGSIQLEWDFNFVSDSNGGVLYLGLSKQMNPKTILGIQFSPGLTEYFRETFWDYKYDVSVRMIF